MLQQMWHVDSEFCERKIVQKIQWKLIYKSVNFSEKIPLQIRKNAEKKKQMTEENGRRERRC